MATEEFKPEANLLHPLATLHWEHCHTLRLKMGRWPAHCAVLDDMVALLTWVPGFGDELHISSCDLQSWTTTKILQHGYMSLTTYKSKFVLVGGWIPSTMEPINRLFTIDEQMKEQEMLPQMPTKRTSPSAVSTKSPEALVVAGGVGLSGYKLNVVEVLQEDHWSTVAPLPQACTEMHSALHDDKLYFMGGIDQNDYVYACSCLELISFCEESSTSTTIGRPLWEKVRAPSPDNIALSYSSYLVSIDNKCTVWAYSKVRCSWVEATSLGNTSGVYPVKYATAAVLPTGELVYADLYNGVYKVKIIVLSFDPDSRFISNVLSRLEAVMEVQIISVLAKYYSQLTTTSKVQLQPQVDYWGKPISSLPDPRTAPGQYVVEVVSQWSAGRSYRPPTWENLLNVFRDIGLHMLNQQIDSFMKDKELTEPSLMLCLEDLHEKLPEKLSACHKVWFGEQLPHSSIHSQVNSAYTSVNLCDVITLRNMRLLKWIDRNGEENKLCILKEISSDWKAIGDMLDISPGRLDTIEMDHPRSVEECCRSVLKEWLDNKGTRTYPDTWKGFCQLLKDLELSHLGNYIYSIITNPENSFL